MSLTERLTRSAILPVVLVLAGCNATPLQPAMPAAPSAERATKSYSEPWLFVSDPGTDEVYIYSLPKLYLIEVDQGFTQPQGECSDTNGDVWVTGGSAKTIYKLSHSGEIIGHLSDTSGYPDGCAYDPKTGNLAVLNLLAPNSKSGALLIYPHASGPPKTYSNKDQFFYNFGGYDSAGDLFFDGRSAQGAFMLAELPVNSSETKTVSVSGGTIYYPGMVQWDTASNRLVVGDQRCANEAASCVYQLAIESGEGAIKVQTTVKNSTGGPVCDMIQGVLWDGRLIGSNFDFCGSEPSATYLWPYPTGGQPTAHKSTSDSEPFGVAISVE